MNQDSSYRVSRVEKEIQSVVAEYLIREKRNRLHGLVSVSKVFISKDLKSAKVFLSTLGASEEQIDENLESVEEERVYIQKYLAKKLPMKHCPVLHFVADHAIEEGFVMNQKISSLDIKQDKKESAAKIEDSENSQESED